MLRPNNSFKPSPHRYGLLSDSWPGRAGLTQALGAMESYEVTKQDRFIGGITIAHAALGIVSALGLPVALLGANLALAVAGVAAGIGWLRNMQWASYLLLLFYAIQLVHVVTPEFRFSFTLGIDISIWVGWFAPAAELGFNLFAVAMLVWATLRTRFKESRKYGAFAGGA